MSDETERALLEAAESAHSTGSVIAVVELSALHELLGEWEQYREWIAIPSVTAAILDTLDKDPQ